RVPREIDRSKLDEVFRFWAPLPSHTVFKGIHELPPGHWLMADQDSIRIERYWRPTFPANSLSDNRNADLLASSPATNEEKLVEEFRELLIDACRIRLRADVPVGAYLSGGLDSSTIASVVRRYTANRLVTFSIAFTDEQFDESGFQQQMAAHLGTDHHVVRA